MSGGGIFDAQGSIAYEKNKDPHNHEFRSKLLVVEAPVDSPNTYGIHMGKSDGVNIIGYDIKTGDDFPK
ncbi:hypothetical protein Gotur_008840 [Gossypium turneri]